MKRLPLVPTLVVLAAVAVMVALGVWQLRRGEWKDGLVAEARAAASLPPVAWPSPPVVDALPLFRRSSLVCLEVTGWRATSGRSRAGESGWVHIASCRTGAEGPGAEVVMGFSDSASDPAWRGGPVAGTIAPDSRALIRLVADTPAPGLEPAAVPSPDDIPNNHRAYAVQWFLFAGAALLVYALAVRRRGRG